jgi:hypothetical protein
MTGSLLFGYKWVGEPLFTSSPGYYQEINHLILNEADITPSQFARDHSYVL